jgi:general secretion pathway protein B
VSFILDALKKAEHDRLPARVPTIATVHGAPERRRPMWPWILSGVLLLNAVLGVAVLRHVRQPSARVDHETHAVGASPPPVAPTALPASTPAPTAAPATAPSREAFHRAPAPLPGASPPDARLERPAPPPETGARSRRNASDMKLEMIVYSENAAERVVYIDGHRYVKGDRVAGGLTVTEIVHDGVVLSGNGQRVVLKQ